MSKLIVVSNRVAIPGQNQTGGLAVALDEALHDSGGLWCGWSGEAREYTRTQTYKKGPVDYFITDLTREDFEDYYIGFSNSALWPLFHYRTDLLHYNSDHYDGYLRVNWRFAELVAKKAAPQDIIWVHDYHLIPMAMALREQGVESRVGFFLHIPFPALETLTALPVATEIVRALCAYDMVGFQTETDLRAFVRCASELLGASTFAPVRSGMVDLRLGERRIRVGVFPISIDTTAMMHAAEEAEFSPHTAQLRDVLGDRILIAGVDRMDYSKGLPARLDAYDMMLARHPQLHRRVRYSQVTPTSRAEVEDYRALREEVEARVARINGTYATLDWSPVHFLTSSFTRDQLAGLYRTAKVGLVTPFRDGMNLVAKEYIACQKPADPGVLILSRFAGAAAELDAALIVNPYDIAGMATTMTRAIAMGIEERRDRHAALMTRLRANTISDWTKKFVDALRSRDEPLRLQRITSMPQRIAAQFPMQGGAA